MILLGGAGANPSNILEFDINKREWIEVGNMNYEAWGIGVFEVNFTDFEPWCQKRSLKKFIVSPPEPAKKGDNFGAGTL